MKNTDTPSIERLKELNAKATPGPLSLTVSGPMLNCSAWPPGEKWNAGNCAIRPIRIDMGWSDRTAEEKERVIADAELVVAAVNFVRDHIATLETLPSAGEGVELDGATPDQMQRANNAVEANLVDGAPKYDSAQGYACALTAIMQTDTLTPSPPLEQPDIEGRARELLEETLRSFEYDGTGTYVLERAAVAAVVKALASPPSRPSFDKWDYARAVLKDSEGCGE